MKKIFLLAAFISSTSFSKDIPIEKDNAVYEGMSSKQVQALAKAVRASGYSCNSISSARPFMIDNGWHITCNNWRYKYEIQDRGGRVFVIPK